MNRKQKNNGGFHKIWLIFAEFFISSAILFVIPLFGYAWGVSLILATVMLAKRAHDTQPKFVKYRIDDYLKDLENSKEISITDYAVYTQGEPYIPESWTLKSRSISRVQLVLSKSL